MRTSSIRIRLTGWLIVTTLFSVACDSSAAAPEGSENTLAASSGLSRTEQERLRAREASESQRVERARQSTRVLYDSLNSAWQESHDVVHSNGGGYGNYQNQVIACEPLQYAADVKVIGPAGGTLSVGPHKLVIPKGALTRYEVITAEIPVALQVSVKFSPSGLRFVRPAVLVLDYRHCRPPEGVTHQMAYVNDAAEVLEWPSSYDDHQLGRLFGTIRHFSKYAVASN